MKQIILQVPLDGNSLKTFEVAKGLSGIKSNTEFVRNAITYYAKNEFKLSVMTKEEIIAEYEDK